MAVNHNLFAIGTAPDGKRRYSQKTMKGKLEAFVGKRITFKELGKIYDHLTLADKATFVWQCAKYLIPLPSPDGISQEEHDRLMEQVRDLLKKQANGTAKTA